MRKVIRVLFGVVLAAVTLTVAAPVQAQIYKYRRKDGTVVYTDKLSDLPPSERKKYARREAEKARKRKELERSIGKRELERREAEEQRRQQLEKQLEQARLQERRQKIQALLRRLNEEEEEENAQREKWRKRVIDARTAVRDLYEQFNKTREAYDNLAVRADYTLFPGQNKEKAELRKKLEELEKQLHDALEELNIRIPTEARKAGIPPGWLRVREKRNPPT